MSKRSVIVAMKVLELVLMLAGTAALYLQPEGGLLPMVVLGLLGVQTAFFVPAKYGILPEILPHERLSAGNGLLEMTSNLAILAGHRRRAASSSISVGSAHVAGRVDPGRALGLRPAGRAGRSRRSRPRGPRGVWRRRCAWPGSRSRPIACCGWP